MCDLIAEIARADASEIEMLIKAVQRRYSELFPDWEVVMISLDKRENRHTQLNNIIQLLEKMKGTVAKRKFYNSLFLCFEHVFNCVYVAYKIV